jgi:hypothetical protein
MLDAAITILPEDTLRKLANGFLNLDELCPDTVGEANLLEEVEAFRKASLADKYYEDFAVSSQLGSFRQNAGFYSGQLSFYLSERAQSRGFLHGCDFMKQFLIAKEVATYFELRMEAQNVFNHADYNTIDNNPNDPTFGGILGKQQYPRVMQVGERIFF